MLLKVKHISLIVPLFINDYLVIPFSEANPFHMADDIER